MRGSKKVIVSGLTAAGKTTHSLWIARKHSMGYISGSQVLLGLSEMSSPMRADFWATDEGLRLTKRSTFLQVDSILKKKECEANRSVFDCLSLPWLKDCPAFCIWLESDFHSRVMKAMVSHGPSRRYSEDELARRVQQKDDEARSIMRKEYGFDLFKNRKPFDLVVDISDFISAPTLEASKRSIRKTETILRPFIEWYLEPSDYTWGSVLSCCRREEKRIKLGGLLASVPSLHRNERLG